MSTNITTTPPETTSSAPAPPTSISSSPAPPSTSAPPPTSSAPPPSSSTPAPPSTTPTPTITSTSAPPSLTTSTTSQPVTSSPTSTSSLELSSTTLVTQFTTTRSDGSTIVQTVTSTAIVTPVQSTPPDASATSSGSLQSGNGSSSGGLNQAGTIAIAVVVPIAVVALLVVAGLFFWRKRKQRKDAEEERRKEVEDYIYNPNADPTLPDVSAGGAGTYEMKEDGSSGYRGWGSTTLAGSTGRKASTTMSGGAAGVAYSDGTSPAYVSDTRSGEPLVSDGSYSPEGEILGAMGPSTSDNRGNVHRGPSNASSSYSAAARSDGSGDNGVGVAYGGPGHYDQYGSNPYENGQQAGGQPVIRDNPARRNTRIENTSHYPQQSAGISQNF